MHFSHHKQSQGILLAERKKKDAALRVSTEFAERYREHSTPSIKVRNTLPSGLSTTKSASAPAARIPFFAIPAARAGFWLAAATASGRLHSANRARLRTARSMVKTLPASLPSARHL